jgi:hypothetical protein
MALYHQICGRPPYWTWSAEVDGRRDPVPQDDKCRSEREHQASHGKAPPGRGGASPEGEQAAYERDKESSEGQ